ncbi:helix-turn-helix domain-containing protein [Pseudoalteromonas distincta]|uniref:helix-turn-helix domain-containing protein n=1 Tax=Pseudoalteromonas distincta TaxID=77608 RepID=UPI00165F6CF6|nr:helix-turn-helix transcriptional regulator [Pseudoalteromonas distincta]MBD0411209.1 helix-turn-helix transcriptional regulator [Pseudoalteromonas distincta]
MIVYNLRELIAAKSLNEGRKITLDEVANAAGVNKAAMSKMANNNNYSTTTRTLDALCEYFDCKIEEIIMHKKK